MGAWVNRAMIGSTDLASYTVAIRFENIAYDDQARARPRLAVMVGKHHNGNAQMPRGIDDPMNGLRCKVGRGASFALSLACRRSDTALMLAGARQDRSAPVNRSENL